MITTPSAVELILEGPRTVDGWLAGPMYSAHRGGSADWPEHSLRAYTEAVRHGFPCLEVSLAKTSDDVFVGNHDADINRVVYGDPGDASLLVSDMTWAQLQGYQIAGPTYHRERGPEPFARLVDLITTYDTHVFMVDPKSVNVGYYDMLLDLLDAHGGNQRFIGKWVGSNIPWSNALAARGYRSWGAFYPADWTPGEGFPAAWAEQWTMLGLSFDASQAHWDEITATGKPVLAHICESEADVAEARSKGAVGFQVSGIEEVEVTA